MAEAQSSKAQAEVTKAEAEKRQVDAQVAAAQAAQAHAGVNAEYTSTMRDAIGGLVRVTNQAQGLLAVQTMLLYAIIAGLAVVLIVLGIVGVYLLRYQIATAQAQRAMWEACVQRLELERGHPRCCSSDRECAQSESTTTRGLTRNVRINPRVADLVPLRQYAGQAPAMPQGEKVSH